jgi:hypothetical protein
MAACKVSEAMKNERLLALAVLFFCGAPAAVDAQGYKYAFIPTESQLYPLSDYTGSYVVLNGPSGSNVDYSIALAGWNFVTAQGTLNSANSHIAGFAYPTEGISWDSSAGTISFVGGAEFYPYGAASPIVVPSFGAVDLNISYQISPFGFQTDNVFGDWHLESVPEPTTFALAGLGLATFLMFRRNASRFWQIAARQ